MPAALESANPAPRLWSWKKLLLGLLGVFAALVVLLLFFDSKLESYEDLIPVPVAFPDATTNGYAFLRDRWKDLPGPNRGDQELLDQMLRGDLPWNSVLAARSQRGHENLAADLKASLALPVYVIPQHLKPDDLVANQNQTFSPSIGRQLALQARAAARDNRMEAALDILRDLHQLAVFHTAGSQGLNSCLIGVSLQKQTAELSCDLLNEAKPNESQTAQMVEIWAKDAPNAPAAMRAWQTEAAMFRHELEDRKSGRLSEPQEDRALFRRLLLKRNQTLNRYHRRMRALMETTFNTYPTLEAAQADGWAVHIVPRQGIGRMLDPNYTGNQLLDEGDIYGSIVKLITNNGVFMPRALRARLALYRWRLVHPDQWPAKLEELVPDYLPAVPLDPWNGGPLIWDATTKTISAVGSDWKSGPPGFDRRSRWFSDDFDSPGLRLELPPPLPAPSPKLRPKPAPKASP